MYVMFSKSMLLDEVEEVQGRQRGSKRMVAFSSRVMEERCGVGWRARPKRQNVVSSPAPNTREISLSSPLTDHATAWMCGHDLTATALPCLGICVQVGRCQVEGRQAARGVAVRRARARAKSQRAQRLSEKQRASAFSEGMAKRRAPSSSLKVRLQTRVRVRSACAFTFYVLW